MLDAGRVEDALGRLRQLRTDAVAGDQGDSMGHGPIVATRRSDGRRPAPQGGRRRERHVPVSVSGRAGQGHRLPRAPSVGPQGDAIGWSPFRRPPRTGLMAPCVPIDEVCRRASIGRYHRSSGPWPSGPGSSPVCPWRGWSTVAWPRPASATAVVRRGPRKAKRVPSGDHVGQHHATSSWSSPVPASMDPDRRRARDGRAGARRGIGRPAGGTLDECRGRRRRLRAPSRPGGRDRSSGSVGVGR